MDVLNSIFLVFTIAAPIGAGVYAVFFSRQFSLAVLRFQKSFWKIDFSERYVRLVQAASVVGGTFLVIAGIAGAAQLLLK